MIGRSLGHENAISAWGYFLCKRYAWYPVAKASLRKSSSPKCSKSTPRIPPFKARSCVRSDDKEIYACALQDAEFHTYLNYKSPEYRYIISSAFMEMCILIWIHRINFKSDYFEIFRAILHASPIYFTSILLCSLLWESEFPAVLSLR